MTEKRELKRLVFDECEKALAQKISIAKDGMNEMQAAANDETKSSAGDKYETGRAMMQLEKDKYAAQLASVVKLQLTLSQIDIEKEFHTAEQGSLVFTNIGVFFLSVSIGKTTVNGVECFFISLVSPIGQLLKGKEKGYRFELNGRTVEVLDIC